MKIIDIIVESIDQKEANEVYSSLIADGDILIAKYFQQTRNSPKYNSIDSALRAAERMAFSDEQKKSEKSATKDVVKPQPSVKAPKAEPTRSDRDPEDWGDRFYGNRYTGSLGRGASLGDVDLDIDFDQQGLRTIGNAIGAAKAVTKPFSSLSKAFKTGMSKAPINAKK